MSNIILVPIKVQGRVIYVPRASEEHFGVVKIADGLNIEEGVLSLGDHIHDIEDVTGLQDILNNKASWYELGDLPEWVQHSPSGYKTEGIYFGGTQKGDILIVTHRLLSSPDVLVQFETIIRGTSRVGTDTRPLEAPLYSRRIDLVPETKTVIFTDNWAPIGASIDDLEGLQSQITALSNQVQGKSKAVVFDTKDQLDNWLIGGEPGFVVQPGDLNIGDKLLIREEGVSDYWWDGETVIIETNYLELTNVLTDAPADGNHYVRKDGEWVICESASQNDLVTVAESLPKEGTIETISEWTWTFNGSFFEGWIDLTVNLSMERDIIITPTKEHQHIFNECGIIVTEIPYSEALHVRAHTHPNQDIQVVVKEKDKKIGTYELKIFGVDQDINILNTETEVYLGLQNRINRNTNKFESSGHVLNSDGNFKKLIPFQETDNLTADFTHNEGFNFLIDIVKNQINFDITSQDPRVDLENATTEWLPVSSLGWITRDPNPYSTLNMFDYMEQRYTNLITGVETNFDSPTSYLFKRVVTIPTTDGREIKITNVIDFQWVVQDITWNLNVDGYFIYNDNLRFLNSPHTLSYTFNNILIPQNNVAGDYINGFLGPTNLLVGFISNTTSFESWQDYLINAPHLRNNFINGFTNSVKDFIQAGHPFVDMQIIDEGSLQAALGSIFDNYIYNGEPFNTSLQVDLLISNIEPSYEERVDSVTLNLNSTVNYNEDIEWYWYQPTFYVGLNFPLNITSTEEWWLAETTIDIIDTNTQTLIHSFNVTELDEEFSSTYIDTSFVISYEGDLQDLVARFNIIYESSSDEGDILKEVNFTYISTDVFLEFSSVDINLDEEEIIVNEL